MPLKEINHYLYPVPSDDLNPSRLRNIDAAAACLVRHLSALVDNTQNRIWVIIDSDCDGITASALLLNYIYYRFPSLVSHFICLFHNGKQHGLADMMPLLTVLPNDLIIVPDAGSNDYDEHAKLVDKGAEVLVLDHHIADYESSSAIVVNN